MPRHLPLFQPIMSSTITLPHIDGGHEEGHQTRRDLVASAVDSVRRFKQSWISIMILIAVWARLVLLILSLPHQFADPCRWSRYSPS